MHVRYIALQFLYVVDQVDDGAVSICMQAFRLADAPTKCNLPDHCKPLQHWRIGAVLAASGPGPEAQGATACAFGSFSPIASRQTHG